MVRLNLKQTLALAGMAKHTFDARRRRDLHGFMLEHSASENAAVADYENSRNKWGVEFALALRCVEWFVKMHGVSVEVADSIVDNNFGELAAAVADGSIDPLDDLSRDGRHQHFLIGRISDVVGRGHIAGTLDKIRDKVLEGAAHYGDHTDWLLGGVVLIDATTVYRLLKPALASSAA